jgi:N-sulfoglucosamine sulfohydrolase
MNKKLSVRAFIAFLSLFFAVVAVVAATAKNPNVVIFLADDHGRAENSVDGNNKIRTPMMASLAKQGFVFNRAFVVSPACGPSRSALLSGLMPARNGAEENH